MNSRPYMPVIINVNIIGILHTKISCTKITGSCYISHKQKTYTRIEIGKIMIVGKGV